MKKVLLLIIFIGITSFCCFGQSSYPASNLGKEKESSSYQSGYPAAETRSNSTSSSSSSYSSLSENNCNKTTFGPERVVSVSIETCTNSVETCTEVTGTLSIPFVVSRSISSTVCSPNTEED